MNINGIAYARAEDVIHRSCERQIVVGAQERSQEMTRLSLHQGYELAPGVEYFETDAQGCGPVT